MLYINLFDSLNYALRYTKITSAKPRISFSQSISLVNIFVILVELFDDYTSCEECRAK